jgi:hypothetical protein
MAGNAGESDYEPERNVYSVQTWWQNGEIVGQILGGQNNYLSEFNFPCTMVEDCCWSSIIEVAGYATRVSTSSHLRVVTVGQFFCCFP